MSPYINKKARSAVLKYGTTVINKPGELNYFLTSHIMAYLTRQGHNKKVGYVDYNEVIGVLECCKQELYRKVVAKYEDKKCELNGEVYD